MCLGMNTDILAPGERCASTSNRNFEGRQGSGGRTHLMSPPMAAAAPFGFKAIISPSCADMFLANCYKTGLLAVVLPPSQVRHLIDLASEDPAALVTVDLEKQEVRGEGFAYRFEIDTFARECLLGGLDEIGLVERHGADITAFETRRAAWLPAVK